MPTCNIPRRNGKTTFSLHYKLVGQGNIKVIFISGIAATLSQWLMQESYFSTFSQFQLCFFDNRGVGETEIPPERLTTSEMAEDVLHLLDFLGWERNIHLVGFSMGGMIAMEAIQQDPTRFSSVAFISTASSLVIPSPRSFLNCLKNMKWRYSKAEKERDQLLSLFPKEWLDAKSNEAYKTNEDWVKAKFSKDIFYYPENEKWHLLNQLMAVITHNVSPKRMSGIAAGNRIRFLVITGDEDQIIPFKYSLRIAQSLGVSCRFVQGTGHLAIIQNHKQVNDVLHSHFLSSSSNHK